MQNILNKIIRYGFYALAFLLPVFFLPTTHLPVLASKQLFAAVLCGLILLLWLVKIMATGELKFKWNQLTLTVGLLAAVVGLSTAFSLSRHQSFLGMAFEADTFFSFILYALIFVLSSNLVENKTQAMRVLKMFLLGTGVLAVLFLIQTLFGSILPWNFSKALGFNPVGTVTLLSLLFGGALVIDTILISNSLKALKKQSKLNFIVTVVIGIFLLTNIVLINHWSTWVAIGLTSILMIWVKGFKKESMIAVCLVILAFIFVLIDIPTNELVELPTDVVLTYKASFNIAKETVFQGFDKFLLGSGPSTFAHDYELFRPLDVNSTMFWQASFTQSVAVFLTFLATLGVLGLTCLLFLMAVFFLQGFKSVLSFASFSSKSPPSVVSNRTHEADRAHTVDHVKPKSLISFCLFIGGFYFLLLWFFSCVNFTLMFFGFLILGLWVALSDYKQKVIELKFKSMQPQRSFFAMLLCIILIVVAVTGLYQISNNYAAAMVFKNGVELVKLGEEDLDEGIGKIRKASEMISNDSYLRNLSQALFIKMRQVQVSDGAEAERVAALQEIINEIELVSEGAVKISPENGQNWINMGNSYIELARMGVSGAGELAAAAYQKSKEFSPKDPLVYFGLATAYILWAQDINAQIDNIDASSGQATETAQVLKAALQEQARLAVESLQKAIQLKPDFTEASELLRELIGD